MFATETNEPLTGDTKSYSRSEKKLNRKLKRHQGAIDGFSMSSDTFEKGMMRQRRPTDIAFIIGFIVFMVAVAGIGISQALTSDTNKLLAHQDADRNFCGVTEKVKDYPLVYWSFDLPTSHFDNNTQALWKSAVCVKTCPDGTDISAGEDYSPTTVQYGTIPTVASTKRGITFGGEEQKDKLDISKLIGGMCIVNNITDFADDFGDNKFTSDAVDQAQLWNPAGKTKLQNKVYVESGSGEETSMIEELASRWYSIVICVMTSMIFAPLYMYIMAYFPTYLAYTAVGLINLVWLSGVASGLYLGVAVGGENGQGGFVLSAVMLLFAVIFDLLLWCYWSMFKQAIAIVDATAHFFISTKRILFVSFAVFVLEIVVAYGALIYLMALYGNLDVVPNPNSLDLQGKIYQDNSNFTTFAMILLFAFLWLNNYCKYQGVMTCMCSVATYYFNSSSDGEGSAEVVQSFYWSNVTHAGSVALGSLLMAIIQILQILCEAAAGDGEGEQNAAQQCAKCCLKCLEDLVEYINTVAYANMAVTGTPFCTSAWNGFILNLKHVVKFYFAQSLATWFVMMGYFFIMVLQCVVFFLVTPNFSSNDIWAFAVVFVFSILVCGVFLGLFDEAVAGTLQCMAVDAELNSGLMSTYSYGPPSFHAKMNAVFLEEKEEEG